MSVYRCRTLITFCACTCSLHLSLADKSTACRGSTVPNQPAGAFWAVLNRLLIIGQTIVLLLSEFGWPSVFFQRFFPILGKDFGLGPLGLMQCLFVLLFLIAGPLLILRRDLASAQLCYPTMSTPSLSSRLSSSFLLAVSIYYWASYSAPPHVPNDLSPPGGTR